jgi:DNA-directed RNA polymerase omega subunit
MNDAYLERAKKVITDPRLLVIATAKRTRQLARGGSRPMVRSNDQNLLDIALLEIAEGLIAIEPGDDE